MLNNKVKNELQVEDPYQETLAALRENDTLTTEQKAILAAWAKWKEEHDTELSDVLKHLNSLNVSIIQMAEDAHGATSFADNLIHARYCYNFFHDALFPENM